MPDTLTIGQFAAHLHGFERRLAHGGHSALQKAANLVREEARREIGTYQDAGGPFAEWPQLAERTQEERVRLGFSANEPGLRTGEMRDSIKTAVGDREAVVGSDDEHLVFFEMGTKNQPPRSVLGLAAVHKEREVVRLLGDAVRLAVIGGATIR